MTAVENCPPGSTLRNWQPGQTITDYLRNCSEGLEAYSESRVAKLWGMTRIHLFRARMMAEIPEDLFELLLAGLRKPGTRELGAIGRWFASGNASLEIESCPHCGHQLRRRQPWSKDAERIITRWRETEATKRGKNGGRTA